MSLRLLLGLFSVLFTQELMAFNCYLTVAKDNCWTNFNVVVTARDGTSNQQLISVSIPQGQQWMRQPWICQPGQNLLFNATFTPNTWANTANKVFHAKNYWSLPTTVKSGETAWELKVCFSNDFALVPMSPDTSGACQCNFNSIPAIVPPMKIE